MNRFFEKLELVARQVDREKGLYFFAVVHPIDGLHDRWDLLVSSPGLKPWSTSSLRYIAGLLQERLRIDDIVKVSRIVVLPRDNDVVSSLMENEQIRTGRTTPANDDEFDRVVLLYPTRSERRTKPVSTGTHVPS